MTVVSIAIKSGYLAIIFSKDGVVKRKIVKPYKATNKRAVINAFIIMFRQIRNYIEVEASDTDFIIETCNNTLVNWIKNRYSKEGYQDIFVEMLDELHSLPIRYTFVYNQNPIAKQFTFAHYCDKEKLTGLDLDISEEE